MPEISLCIDRFEGDICVCTDEKKQIHHFPRALLPEGAGEGAWLIRRKDALLLDANKTRETHLRITRKMEKLWE